MMSSLQSEFPGTGPSRLHRPFRFYDPEVLAVITILLGLFQLLLGLPTYYLSVNLRLLYMCPVLVGSLHLTGGSFAMACERSPSRNLLKNCLYFCIGGLLVGLCAIAVYGYAMNDITYFHPCDPENQSEFPCARDEFVDFYNVVTALLLVYDMAAIILQCFLSFSAVQALKRN